VEKPSVVIVIPAWNEATTIGDVVREALPFGAVVVVDDCSTDATTAVATAAGAITVTHRTNVGYEGAIESGFTRAMNLGATQIVTLDADGQHDPTYVPKLCARLDSGAWLVVGTRPVYARIAERIFGWWTTAQWGIADPLSGMKAYRVELLQKFGKFDRDYRVGTDLLVRAGCARLPLAQIPITCKPRIGQPRFASTWRANARIFRAMMLGLRHYYRGENH
jgi:glycosyltransferase involved in cell wall biosynthesis